MNNYECRIFKYEDDWVCEYPDLQGCTGIGTTPEEAVLDGEEAKALWLEDYYEENKSYPEASGTYGREYSGRFNLRMRPSLHRELVICAKNEGVSLNALCCQFLAWGLGRKQESKTFSINIQTTACRDIDKKYSPNSSWEISPSHSKRESFSLVNAS